MGFLGDDLTLAVIVFLTLVFAVVRPVSLWSSAVDLGWRRVAAVPPALLAGALVLYVMAEDDYEVEGRSRWEIYGAGANALVVVAVGAAVAAAAIGHLSYRRRSAAGPAALACGVAAMFAVAARVAMSN